VEQPIPDDVAVGCLPLSAQGSSTFSISY